MNKVQRTRAVDNGVVQSHYSIYEKDSSIVIFACEKVGAYKRPADIWRYLSEESFRVAFAQVIEDLGDLAFAWIFSGGYAPICRAVLCWRRDCKSRHDGGSEQKNLERGMHYGFCSVEERRQGADLVEMEVPSLNRLYTFVRNCIERSQERAGKRVLWTLQGFMR